MNYSFYYIKHLLSSIFNIFYLKFKIQSFFFCYLIILKNFRKNLPFDFKKYKFDSSMVDKFRGNKKTNGLVNFIERLKIYITNKNKQVITKNRLLKTKKIIFQEVT